LDRLPQTARKRAFVATIIVDFAAAQNPPWKRYPLQKVTMRTAKPFVAIPAFIRPDFRLL
jgi:hypothetical protein